MHTTNPAPVLALLVVIVLVCLASGLVDLASGLVDLASGLVDLASGLVDWVEQVLARPRLRPRMVIRMYRLARPDHSICRAWYLARSFEKATRPKAN